MIHPTLGTSLFFTLIWAIAENHLVQLQSGSFWSGIVVRRFLSGVERMLIKLRNYENGKTKAMSQYTGFEGLLVHTCLVLNHPQSKD